MGAPLNHPFFGNQYTNGGYIAGSFTYTNAEAATRSLPATAMNSTAQDAARRLVIKPGLSIPSLVASGVAGLVRGVVLYAYVRKRFESARQTTSEDADIANFGVCGSCGVPLASAGPAEVQQDEHGDFIACEECGQPNYARATDAES